VKQKVGQTWKGVARRLSGFSNATRRRGFVREVTKKTLAVVQLEKLVTPPELVTSLKHRPLFDHVFYDPGTRTRATGLGGFHFEARQGGEVYRESGGRCPDVSVVAANDGVLDHLGAQKLVVDVALPTHLDLDNVAAEEELVSKTLTTKLTTLTLDKSLTDNSLEELKVASLRLQLLFPT